MKFQIKLPTKPEIVRAAIILMAIACAVVSPAEDTSTKNPLSIEPTVSIREALAIAERYVAEHRIDLSEQYIGGVSLLYDEALKKQLYWHIQWRWKMPRIGGEYGLRVYMDGTVDEARLGP